MSKILNAYFLPKTLSLMHDLKFLTIIALMKTRDYGFESFAIPNLCGVSTECS